MEWRDAGIGRGGYSGKEKDYERETDRGGERKTVEVIQFFKLGNILLNLP
jgi:hypothetical protein